MNNLKNLPDLLINNFGFENMNEFYNSFIHTKILHITIPLTFLTSFFDALFGLNILTVLAFIILLVLELLTGLVASKIKNVKIESRKFSRFGIKLLTWLLLLFITNTFKIQYENETEYFYYRWLNSFVFMFVTTEYLISVLENISVISGKSYKKLISDIKQKNGENKQDSSKNDELY
jgi:phage-related holin